MAKHRPKRSKSGRPVTPAPSRAGTALDASVPVLVHLAVGWMWVGALELGFSGAIPTTALRSGQLAIAARLGLAGYGLLLLAANVCLVGVPVQVLTYLGRSGRHPILRCASAGVAGMVLW